MASNDRLSAAEQGVGPRHSIDGGDIAETSPLLRTNDNCESSSSLQPQNNNNKRPNNSHLKRSLSEKARKRIIVILTSISGVLLVILGVTLASKVGSSPGTNRTCPQCQCRFFGSTLPLCLFSIPYLLDWSCSSAFVSVPGFAPECKLFTHVSLSLCLCFHPHQMDKN